VLVDQSKKFNTLSIATGYWDLKGMKMLMPHIKKYKQIRLVIGREILIPRHSIDSVEEDYPDQDIFKDLEKLDLSQDDQVAVKEILELIKNDQLEVKILKKNFLHAKCYIFGNHESNEAIGIIGSSNFTGNGLSKNYELNSLESDSRIVQYKPVSDDQEHGHLSWYEDLWNSKNCIDWNGEYSELLSTSNNGNILFSPYEMYIKVLATMYEDAIEEDREVAELKSLKLLDFQKRNVQQLMNRIKKHGVAMLADSVGLGKTISALGIINDDYYKNKRVVVISPSSLVTQWRNELIKQGILGAQVVSMQNLEEISREQSFDRWVPVSLFVIDESHNLRTYGGKRFQAISNWITNNEDADTLLLTATPINNSIDDITNQILIGSRGEQDLVKVNVRTSEGVVKSKSFFDALQDIKKKISQNRAAGSDMSPIYEEARQVIDPVLREFVIRNTRQSIIDELDGAPLTINDKKYFFPSTKVNNIQYQPMKYDSLNVQNFNDYIEKSSTNLLIGLTDFLEHPLRQLKKLKPEETNSDKSITYKLYLYILSLSFIPYRSSMYEKSFYGKNIDELKSLRNKKNKLNMQLSIYGLIRTNFLKRYESSSNSLLISIKRYKENLSKFKYLLDEKGVLVNLGELNLLGNDYSNEKIGGEYLNFEDEEKLNEIIKMGRKINKNDFKLKEISEDIEHENHVIDCIIDILENIEDRKLEKFLNHIESIKKEKYKKFIVFSFYSDTIEYLEKKLQKTKFIANNHVAFVSGKNKKDALTSADLFSPIARDFQINANQHEIDYLFTTDVLSEGQNLQDCGYLINYDLHWNPVRMIQRNGRINRLGSNFDQICVTNIIPDKDLEEIIGLVDKLETKIDLIQTTIGNDASVLGEKIKHTNFKGIYATDELSASEAYKNLEHEADVFSDDKFINDLRIYLKEDSQSIESIKKIPLKKWGIIDKNKDANKLDSIVFAQANFTNSKSIYTFYRNNLKGDQLGLLLNGEALEILRSFDKNRKKDNLNINKNLHFQVATTNGTQITRFEVNNNRLTPSQSSIMDEALNNGWDSDQREKLENFLTSRNVFQNKTARKFTLKIRKMIREGNRENIKEIFDEMENHFKDAKKLNIKIKSIDPIHGFARNN